ncbi:MAG: hypothetical protein NUV97_02455 [archaeon]|nr:hypothetical protein [archaeon]MCR4323808.1 hypothetical protein [Nanoarchaeota archaeon]
MAIITPKFLPGEEGYIPKKERTAKKKSQERKKRNYERKKEQSIGKIRPGSKGFRMGKSKTTPQKEVKYPLWRYSKKIGEITIINKGLPTEEINLKFNRFGGIGNHKHLIQDADFQLAWAVREQELRILQNDCYLCKKKLSKSAQPNLYHTKMWNKRMELLEEASKVPQEVIEGKLTIEEGWNKFNEILESGNRYYMSLKDTALICPSCVKTKGMVY